MSRTSWIVLVGLVALVAASAPVHADEAAKDEPVPCTKVWTDPPDVEVDPACIVEIIEDLPPRAD